jgi:hypothetical protein
MESASQPRSGATLIRRHRGNLFACAGVLIGVGACYVAPERVAAVVGTSTAMLKLAASATGLAVLAWAASTVRCQRCGLSLVWHAVSTKPAGDWLRWLLEAKSCPRCGHTGTN